MCTIFGFTSYSKVKDFWSIPLLIPPLQGRGHPLHSSTFTLYCKKIHTTRMHVVKCPCCFTHSNLHEAGTQMVLRGLLMSTLKTFDCWILSKSFCTDFSCKDLGHILTAVEEYVGSKTIMATRWVKCKPLYIAVLWIIFHII